MPHDKPTLISQVHEKLKQAIFEFSMAPGDRYSESELAARVGASRTPLRIALHTLLHEGYLVKVDGHSCWMVRPLDFGYFEEIYDVRINLELLALHRICEAKPFPDLDELRVTWLVTEAERERDPARVAALDERFHNRLVAAAGNREMARIHADLQERMRIIRRLDFTVPERIDDAYVHHGKILRAVLARKEDEAALLLRDHIEASKAEIRHITLHRLSMARGLVRGAHH